MQIPVFEKDVIKDTIYQSLGFGDKDWSRRIGLASINMLFAIANQILEADNPLSPRPTSIGNTTQNVLSRF